MIEIILSVLRSPWFSLSEYTINFSVKSFSCWVPSIQQECNLAVHCHVALDACFPRELLVLQVCIVHRRFAIFVRDSRVVGAAFW